MRLFEITTTIPWEWTNLSDEQANASFIVGNIKYEFTAKNSEYEHLEQVHDQLDYDPNEDDDPEDYSGYWLVEFKAIEIGADRVAPGDNISMTGTGNSAQVIAAITAIMGSFLYKYQDRIDVIEYDTQYDRSRISLYSRLFRKFLPGWQQVPGKLHDVEVINPEG
jgi:hypothetical protein